MSFTLDARLAADTLPVGDLALSRVLLMNDARWHWLILAPRCVGLVEIVDLSRTERAELMEEIAAAVELLRTRAGVEKVNVGALGNIVRQLHVHVVARRPGDAAWPGPVWGFGRATPYEREDAAAKVAQIRAGLQIK